MAAQGLWNIGSFNLPDFGISEALGIGPRNSAITNTKGANTSVNTQRYDLASSIPPASFNTGGNNNTGGNQRDAFNSLRSSGGGGSTGGTTQPTQQQGPSAFDMMSRELDNAYGEQMNYLNNLASSLGAARGRNEQGVIDQFGVSKNSLTSEKGISERALDTQEQGGAQRKEDAITAARRLYNELKTGGQQRFGGASSAGEAYSALAGRELQRNNAGIQQNFENFMQQVEGARTNLNERFNQGLQQLELQKNQALQQVRNEFENKLMEINRMKAQAGAEKANRRLEALQNLRNNIFQINLAEAQMSNSLTQQKAMAEQELQSAISLFSRQAQSGQQAGMQFGANTTTNPETGLTFGQSMGGQPEFAMTGSIREDEDPMGAITTPRRQDEAFNFAS